MKNKLFLLPILALGTLLGACKEKIDPIYIDEWLNNAKNVTESDCFNQLTYLGCINK